MKILFVCSADFAAPSEKHALGWAEGLAARGHETMIAIRSERTAPAVRGGVKVIAYRFRGPRPNPGFLRAVKQFGPCIVHAFNPRLGVIAAVEAVANLVASCLVCVHFEDDEWGLAFGGASRPNASRRVLRVGGRLAGAVKPDVWPFATRGSLRWATRAGHGLDALTPMLSTHVAERAGRHCQTLLPVLPVLPDCPAPQPDARPIPLPHVGSDVVLYTGAVYGAHRSDFMILLRAIATLREGGMDVGLVQTGHLARRLAPAAMLVEAKLDPTAARFMGYVPSSSISALLRAADVLVQPGAPTAFNSLRLPSKLQPYLASGTPTVTFAAGFGTMLRDRKEVLKTHGPTPEELGDRIAEVLSDSQLAATLSAGGPEAAERLFDRDRNTEALIAHYDRLLAARL